MKAETFLRRAAWSCLLEFSVDRLPVDVAALAVRMGCRVMDYEALSLRIHKPVPYIVDSFDAEGFVVWSRSESRFVIAYNAAYPAPVIRWTLAHEVGHVYLRHVTPSAPVLCRVRGYARDLMEAEADSFARRILCPSIVLHDCRASTPSSIATLCGISRQASIYRAHLMQSLERRGEWGSDPLERQVRRQFAPFVRDYLDSEFSSERYAVAA